MSISIAVELVQRIPLSQSALGGIPPSNCSRQQIADVDQWKMLLDGFLFGRWFLLGLCASASVVQFSPSTNLRRSSLSTLDTHRTLRHDWFGEPTLLLLT